MRLLPLLAALLLAVAPAARATGDQDGKTYFVVVGGLGGEAVYAEMFGGQVSELEQVFSETTGNSSVVHSLSGEEATRQTIEDLFTELRRDMQPEDRFALFLIGHGTFDGKEYKFNIPGPDITATRFRQILDMMPAEQQLVANSSSSSGVMLEALAAERRIVITATRSGGERNATVFGRYWVDALSDEEADTDKNEIITAQEAFLYAEKKVKDFYEKQNRLATEHPRLQGDLAASFTLSRLGTALEVFQHPALAPHFRDRDRYYRQIDELKLRKDSLDEDAYYDQLEALLIKLARAEQRIERGLQETETP